MPCEFINSLWIKLLLRTLKILSVMQNIGYSGSPLKYHALCFKNIYVRNASGKSLLIILGRKPKFFLRIKRLGHKSEIFPLGCDFETEIILWGWRISGHGYQLQWYKCGILILGGVPLPTRLAWQVKMLKLNYAVLEIIIRLSREGCI